MCCALSGTVGFALHLAFILVVDLADDILPLLWNLVQVPHTDYGCVERLQNDGVLVESEV